MRTKEQACHDLCCTILQVLNYYLFLEEARSHFEHTKPCPNNGVQNDEKTVVKANRYNLLNKEKQIKYIANSVYFNLV